MRNTSSMENKNMNIDQRDIFLRGKHIVLKVLTEDDVVNSNWYGWFNDEKTTENMQKHYYPNTVEDQLSFFNSLINEKNKIQLGVKTSKEDVLIGVVSLQNIDFINSNADISLIIGEKGYRDLTYAEEAMKLMIDHALFTLNLHKIHGGYLETLKIWGKFLKKRFGFSDEGILKEHVYKNGKYIDIHRIGLIKDDYINHVSN